MKTIDLATWRRREHFEFFRRVDLPFYNINANVDVTGLEGASRSTHVSLNTLLLFATMKAVNAVENLRYRLRGDAVVLHDTLNPVFAHLAKGDDLFRMIPVEFVDDLAAFRQRVIGGIDASTAYFDLGTLVGRDDWVFISSLPWIAFTGTDHTLSLTREDAIPRITWGRIHAAGRKMLLPYNIQVNHMFVDGIHVGRFFEALNDQIRDLVFGAKS